MTLEEVLHLAKLYAPGERFKVWSTCGTHDLSALSRTATGERGESLRYCERCLCVWSADDVVLNRPKGRHSEAVAAISTD